MGKKQKAVPFLLIYRKILKLTLHHLAELRQMLKMSLIFPTIFSRKLIFTC